MPEIVDVALLSTWGGVTVVSVKREAKERVPGLAKRAAMTVKALKASIFVKNLVVVDEDIDVHDPHQLLWCLSVRFQGAKDLTVIPGITGNYLDPSEPWLGMGQGYTSYTIFDCTEKPAPYDTIFRRGLALPAADVSAEVARRWGPAGYSTG
jgi:UbiD family decarboxylase